MSARQALNRLEQTQAVLLNDLQQVAPLQHNRQYHPDLSPLGWHLGHCVFTDNYWLHEILLDDHRQSDELRALYIPEFSPKDDRAQALPDVRDLYRWARQSKAENLRLLQGMLASGRRERLLQDGYIADFLCQHYAQHRETCLYILAQGQAQHGATAPGATSLRPSRLSARAVSVPGGPRRIGSEDGNWAYDNELPAFTASLDPFRIATHPVTNAEYLYFVEDGGYERRELWSEAGWQWRRRHGISAPEHWRAIRGGGFHGIDIGGPCPLPPAAPVHGLSLHEARAFAAWAGARLPHEYEWETARKLNLLRADGHVWEWCDNIFHPYPGFRPFPYEGYSVPYFDDRHYSLRGGSDYSCDNIRRPSFRNYFEAGKRHMRAGLRLVFVDHDAG